MAWPLRLELTIPFLRGMIMGLYRGGNMLPGGVEDLKLPLLYLRKKRRGANSFLDRSGESQVLHLLLRGVMCSDASPAYRYLKKRAS
jgi:hypothetical protein